MLSMLASAPWFQFNPLSLMNGDKGPFVVNLGHWDVVRLRGDAGRIQRSGTGGDPLQLAVSYY